MLFIQWKLSNVLTYVFILVENLRNFLSAQWNCREAELSFYASPFERQGGPAMGAMERAIATYLHLTPKTNKKK